MLRPCSFPGCGDKAEYRGRCKLHARTYEDSKPYRDLYGSKKWENTSIAWRKKHPLCAVCEKEGRVTPASEVDHVEPHRGDSVKFFDNNNIQSICRECHQEKTRKERGR